MIETWKIRARHRICGLLSPAATPSRGAAVHR
jgi:hypothetical protein